MRAVSRPSRIGLRRRSVPGCFGLELLESRRLLSPFTVSNTNDSGSGSLRKAISDANGSSGADTIQFAIPGTGVHTITPTTALPTITDPVIIDGYTQQGSSVNTLPLDQGDNAVLLIEINGSGAGSSASGLTISAGTTTVRGLVIDQFQQFGILLDTKGGDHIEGNFVGTDPTGLLARPNGLANGDGILSDYGAPDMTFGGPDVAQRNIVSGNGSAGNGRELLSRGNRAVIQGNYFGFGADGKTIVGAAYRVSVVGAASTIGGTAAGEGNVIAGGGGTALAFDNAGTGNMVGGLVQGNKIGVNAAGTATVHVNGLGVDVAGWTGVTIGGTAAGAANIIGSFNAGVGVRGSQRNLIQGNFIGTDPTGTLNFGNGSSYGVAFLGSSNNTVGGTTPGARNVIANALDGVYVDTLSSGNSILSNSILAVSSKGIDLEVTAGGKGNNGQAAPVLTSLTRTHDGTLVSGTIDSTPNTAFTVQLFVNDSCGPNAFGPGEALLGTITTSTSDATGHVDFRFTVANIPDGEFLSATATDPAGNTSEFSFDMVVGPLIVKNTFLSGPGSLSEAIDCSNLLPGTDTIDFAIPGSGVQTIRLGQNLPVITDPVIIDGYSQPGSSPNTLATGDDAVLLIELDGTVVESPGAPIYGLTITAADTIVRGLIINRFRGHGIVIAGLGGDLIEGNFIGTDASGSVDLANSGDAVRIIGQNGNNTIGGTAAAARNILSGNGSWGIEINSSGNLVQGNLIGVNVDGDPLGNGRDGVIIGSASDNTIGGTDDGAGNVIADNLGVGVNILGGQGTSILGNSIFGNTNLGIDIAGDGVTQNDQGDADTGPNDRQNYPVIASATISGGLTTIGGTLNSTPGSTFLVQFFGNTDADPSGFGEGETLLGSVSVPTDSSGNGSFNMPFVGAPNFVSATATDASGNTSEFSRAVPTATLPAELSVALSAAPKPVTAGTDLTYTLTVHTAGPGDAIDVSVSDPLPAGTSFVSASNGGTFSNGTVTWNLGTIAAGSADTTLSLVVQVNAAQTAGLSNTATVSSTTPDPVSANNTAMASTAVITSADLSISNSDSPDPVTAGTELTYTLTVHTAGPSDALGVSVSDPLPAGTSFVSATNGGALSNGTVIWNLGTIAAGSADTALSLVVHVNAAQTAGLSNTATVSSTTPDPVSANNSATAPTAVTPAAPASADLSITNSDDPDPVTAGTDLTYTLTGHTAGPGNALGVSVSDTLPTGTSFVSASNGGTFSNGTVTWNVGTIAAGAQDTRLTLVILVNAADTAGLSDTASVSSITSDPVPGNNTATAATAVTTSADLSLTNVGGSAQVTAGTDLTYTLTVHTAGPSDALGVSVTDVLPTGTSFVSASNGGTFSNGTVTWNLGTIAAGAPNSTLTLVVRVNAGLTGSLSNAATVSSATIDPGKSNSSSSATTPIVPANGTAADLAIVNSGSPNPVVAGADLTYTLTVYTAGPDDALGVSVRDPLPTGTSFVSASAGGSFSNGMVTWDLGTIAAGAPDTIVTLVVQVDAAQSADLIDTAAVSSTTSDPVSANNRATAKTTVIPAASSSSADLSVTFGPAPNIAVAGRDLTYTLTVKNAGPGPATGVILTQTLPPGTTFVSATGGVSPVNGELTFQLGSLAPGVTTITVVVRPIPGTARLATRATIKSNEPNRNPGNSTTTQDRVVMTPPGDGPRIVGVRRYGFHRQPTLVVLDIYADGLDPVRAANALNYTVTSAGKDGVFGTKDDVKFAVRRATYNAQRKTVTLAFNRRLYLFQAYDVRINGAAAHGVMDTSGRLLDGDADGNPGGDYLGQFNRSSLAGSASQASEAAVAKARPAPKPTVDLRIGASHPGGHR
jgi:uncharacterized repeat protein (TIGR01451 family)